MTDAAYPLSFTQQQLLFFDQLTPGNVTYNAALAIRALGELDQDLLRVSLDQIFKRHEALLNEPALPLQTLRIVRVRLDEARSLIRGIDVDTKRESKHEHRGNG